MEVVPDVSAELELEVELGSRLREIKRRKGEVERTGDALATSCVC